jgi:putative transposase
MEYISKNNIIINEMEFDKDHIQLISYLPTLSIATIISRFKQHTTYYIWIESEYKSTLESNFWRERTFWSGGYFASSMGQASKATIEEYIRQQG